MMKRIGCIIIALVALVLSSCSKMPCNGKLDGLWQLMEVQVKANAADSLYSQVHYKKQDRIYWAFQLDLLNIRSNTKIVPDAFARFRYQNGQLEIPLIYISESVRDVLLTDEQSMLFEPTGIIGNHECYEVETIGRKRMILKTEKRRLIFRKF